MTGRREGEGKIALVTGASAGIGASMARALGRHGFDLVLTARRADRLTAFADELQRAFGVRARTYPGDLALAQTCTQLVHALQRDGIAIDFLVNNAGYGIHERYHETPWEVQRDFVQVMVAAPCELVHRLLPGMMRRGYGRIINVASVAGFLPGVRGNTLYGASKAFLISFSQSLHSEQRGTGVHVTALCPGLTYSEFHDVTGTRSRMQRLPKFLWLNADRVVEDGYQAVMRNQAICVPGAQYRAIVALARKLPLRLAHRVAALR
jgi:short-subunit dehydrogenase